MTNLEKFIERAKQVHGNLYDYDGFNYVDARTKGDIRCLTHGLFSKSPDKHIHRQQGCPHCSNAKKAIAKADTKETFIIKARQRYGDAHDYIDVVYVDSRTAVSLRCMLCGEAFSRNPAQYLGGEGCKGCAKQERVRQNIEKYGVDHHTKTAEYREKVKKTSLERFGVEHASKTQEFKDRAVQTSLNRYGVRYASQMPEFQKNIRQTYVERYGVEHHNQRHLSKESLHQHEIELSHSSYEDALVNFLREHAVVVERNNRTLIAPLEVDILLHDHKIGIEIGSNSLHSNKALPKRGVAKPKYYHLTKLERMAEKGYRLITIFEDEWLHHRNIVETRLLHILGKGAKGKGARHLSIRSIEPKVAKQFLDTYHIQGNGTYGIAKYGAFDGDALVAVMTFGHQRRSLGHRHKSGSYELLRFSTDGKSYAGAASRLFTAFVRDYEPSQVISYADKRWSTGDLYKQLGFKFSKASQPSHWYIGKKKTREHRYAYRKSKILHLVENGQNKTEFQIMGELNRDWIWDCGTFSFIW